MHTNSAKQVPDFFLACEFDANIAFKYNKCIEKNLALSLGTQFCYIIPWYGVYMSKIRYMVSLHAKM